MPSLYAGFTGVAWAVEHLQGPAGEDEEEEEGEDANEDIDAALLGASEPEPLAARLRPGLGWWATASTRSSGCRAPPRSAAWNGWSSVWRRSPSRAEGGRAWFTPPV